MTLSLLVNVYMKNIFVLCIVRDIAYVIYIQIKKYINLYQIICFGCQKSKLKSIMLIINRKNKTHSYNLP